MSGLSIMRTLLLLIVIPYLLLSCAPATVAPTALPPTHTPTTVPTGTPVVCQPSKIQESQIGFGEIQGEMQSGGELWALLFFKNAWAKADQKIIWRITGESGSFEAQAQNETGMVIEPIWLEYHDGSNWERPGQEWGTGFNFPEPGCWTITVTYGETIGTISLKVLG